MSEVNLFGYDDHEIEEEDHGVSFSENGPWYADMFKLDAEGSMQAFYQIRLRRGNTIRSAVNGVMSWDNDRHIAEIYFCRDRASVKGPMPEPMAGEWWADTYTDKMRPLADFSPWDRRKFPGERESFRIFHSKIRDRLKNGYDFSGMVLHRNYYSQIAKALAAHNIDLEKLAKDERETND